MEKILLPMEVNAWNSLPPAGSCLNGDFFGVKKLRLRRCVFFIWMPFWILGSGPWDWGRFRFPVPVAGRRSPVAGPRTASGAEGCRPFGAWVWEGDGFLIVTLPMADG